MKNNSIQYRNEKMTPKAYVCIGVVVAFFVTICLIASSHAETAIQWYK
jgi:hypothetical protein